jgi:hypothetical protein
MLIELCTVTIPHSVDEVNSWLINLNDMMRLVMIYYSINDGCDHEETPTLPFDYVLQYQNIISHIIPLSRRTICKCKIK